MFQLLNHYTQLYFYVFIFYKIQLDEDDVNRATQEHLKGLNESKNARNKQIDARLNVAEKLSSLTTVVASALQSNSNNGDDSNRNNNENNYNNYNHNYYNGNNYKYNNVNKNNNRNVLDFLLSNEYGKAGISDEQVKITRSFYFTANEENRAHFIASYESLNKNGNSDKTIWDTLKQIVAMMQGK